MTSRAIRAASVSLLLLAACQERSANAPARTPPAEARSDVAPRPSGGLVESPPALSGSLPLKHGIYVVSDISCADPPNAAIRRYDGLGLSGAHTRDCRIDVLEKQGAAYEIDQSCIDAGSGPAPRSSERATIEVRDNLTFVLKRGRGAETFRHCAASLLPPGLREWAEPR